MTPALVRVHDALGGVRSALDRDQVEAAGVLLSAALRDVETDAEVARIRLDPEAAAAFEEVRRAAERWQAGRSPSADESTSVVAELDREATRLLGRGGPTAGSPAAGHRIR